MRKRAEASESQDKGHGHRRRRTTPTLRVALDGTPGKGVSVLLNTTHRVTPQLHPRPKATDRVVSTVAYGVFAAVIAASLARSTLRPCDSSNLQNGAVLGSYIARDVAYP